MLQCHFFSVLQYFKACCKHDICLQHIDKVFKHKELQQQLVDAKLQRTAELMREVEEKQQREREFVSIIRSRSVLPELGAVHILHCIARANALFLM